MNYALRLVLTVCLLFTIHRSVQADSILTIGNSLTWDMKPYDLDGDVDYHIFCSRNLKYIYDNPNGHCVDSSTPWTTALSSKQYDWLSVQPFGGTTLAEDVAIISEWMTMQPHAKLVIHPGWTAFSTFPNDYSSGNPDNQMMPSPEYISDLIDRLQVIDPTREIRSTRSNDLLYSVWQDIEAGIGPFESLDDLSRDSIHMGLDTGRYLAHNALRAALGQPISEVGFTMDPEVKSYFDSKLIAVPEPTSVSLTFVASLLLLVWRPHRRMP